MEKDIAWVELVNIRTVFLKVGIDTSCQLGREHRGYWIDGESLSNWLDSKTAFCESSAPGVQIYQGEGLLEEEFDDQECEELSGWIGDQGELHLKVIFKGDEPIAVCHYVYSGPFCLLWESEPVIVAGLDATPDWLAK